MRDVLGLNAFDDAILNAQAQYDQAFLTAQGSGHTNPVTQIQQQSQYNQAFLTAQSSGHTNPVTQIQQQANAVSSTVAHVAEDVASAIFEAARDEFTINLIINQVFTGATQTCLKFLGSIATTAAFPDSTSLDPGEQSYPDPEVDQIPDWAMGAQESDYFQ